MNELASFRSRESTAFWTPEWALHGTASSPPISLLSQTAARLIEPVQPLGTALSFRQRPRAPQPTVQSAAPSSHIERRLFEALAAMKIKTAEVAMHLSGEWRTKLFSYLDFMHDAEDWDEGDEPAKLTSFTTFLRMIMHLKSPRRPGMGLTASGHLVATWTSGDRHLTVECLADDEVIWSVAVKEGDGTETAAGRCNLRRIGQVLQPYNPAAWFENVG